MALLFPDGTAFLTAKYLAEWQAGTEGAQPGAVSDARAGRRAHSSASCQRRSVVLADNSSSK